MLPLSFLGQSYWRWALLERWAGVCFLQIPIIHAQAGSTAINMTLAFCMGSDLQAIYDSAQPMAQILFNGFGQKGTLGIWAIIVLVQCVDPLVSLTAILTLPLADT